MSEGDERGRGKATRKDCEWAKGHRAEQMKYFPFQVFLSTFKTVG